MEKPSRTPKAVRKDLDHQTEHIFCLDINYSPEDLRRIADLMDEESVVFIKVKEDCSGATVVISVLETPKEAESRYRREYADWMKWKESQRTGKAKEKEALIKRAKELGLIVTDKPF